MINALLILTLSTASIGFIIWYFLSSSLRLPVRYQIMYDANPPYVNRIFRRRIAGLFIYGLIPLYIIRCTEWIHCPTLDHLNIHFTWNEEVALWTVCGAFIVLIVTLMTTPKHESLEQYPEVRVRFWRPNILILSAVYWILYITAYEFFYRGLLFQSLRLSFGNDLVAVVGTTAIYSLSHYFKLNRITIASIIYGAISCYIVIVTESLIAPIVIHLSSCLFTEWLSIKHHREMYVRRT